MAKRKLNFLRMPSQLNKVRLLLRLGALLAGTSVFLGSSFAQGASPTEYELKAAYLYNFSRFIEWPSPADPSQQEFNICVFGQDPFGRALNTVLDDKTIAGRNVKTKRMVNLEDIGQCQILFISTSEQKHLKQILTTLDGASILTVSDMPEFNDRGGMMQFVWEGNRVRFAVNLPIARKAGLVLSSELLKVAVSVKGAGPLGD
jgi:hypothetical protein